MAEPSPYQKMMKAAIQHEWRDRTDASNKLIYRPAFSVRIGVGSP